MEERSVFAGARSRLARLKLGAARFLSFIIR
jgi:hypothetical protein